MGWYYDNGYFNVDRLFELGRIFNFVVGGRGTGKTYGSIKYCIAHKLKFVYLRRTQTEVDLISEQKYNPCVSVAADMGDDVIVKRDSKYTAVFRLDDNIIGYAMALSTISHIRGFDAHDIDVIIYDEFIPEAHARPIKSESDALFNAYETINRNRELVGRKPVLMWCFANANRLDNPVFMSLHLVERVLQMRNKGIEEYIDNKRSICVVVLSQSPIGEKKRDTALYKALHGSEFEQMAIDNQMHVDDGLLIRSVPLKEYIVICRIGEVCIYKHRSEGSYYCTQHISGSPVMFGLSDADRKRFGRKYYYLIDAYLGQRMLFENRFCEFYFTSYVNM